MLTKLDAAKMISRVIAMYPNCFRDIDEERTAVMVETWHDILKDYPVPAVAEAFKYALTTCKFPPTIADITERINEMSRASEASDTELWEQLTVALDRHLDLSYQFAYTHIPPELGISQGQAAQAAAQRLYEALPDKLKEYCGGYGGFVTISETEDLSYEKGRFLKMMPTIENRLRIKATVSQELLDACSGKVLGIGGGKEET